MCIIVDLHHRQIGAALARPIEPGEPGAAVCGSGAGSPDGAEIILFPRLKPAGAKRARKPLKRRFAVKAERASQEWNAPASTRRK
jgi:hypothetical protein